MTTVTEVHTHTEFHSYEYNKNYFHAFVTQIFGFTELFCYSQRVT